jgi:hypothetical protein
VRTVCVIGAGSSGLVSAKHLRDAGYQVTVLEKSTIVGGAFVSKAYDDSHLVSSCYLTAFSDLRILSPAKPHLSLPEYTEYLSRYADEFELRPLIRFSTSVVRVERRETSESGEAGGYDIHTSPTRADAYPIPAAESTLRFDAVCVCCGLHETPFIPAIPGADGFSGLMLHSAEYKDAAMFEGKRALVSTDGLLPPSAPGNPTPSCAPKRKPFPRAAASPSSSAPRLSPLLPISRSAAAVARGFAEAPAPPPSPAPAARAPCFLFAAGGEASSEPRVFFSPRFLFAGGGVR